MSDGGSGVELILMEAEQRQIKATCALNDGGVSVQRSVFGALFCVALSA